MAFNTSEARLTFLREAAHQLASSAPVISASLSTAYTRSVIDAEEDLQRAKKEWDTLRREFCGACGNIMLPGWSSSVIQSSVSKKKKRSKLSHPSPKKQIVSTCLRCDRKSVQHLPTRPPKHVTLKRKPKDVETPMIINTNTPGERGHDKVSKSANATSKQRKKSRKGGLQAMLEKNKTQSSGQGGLGLDLMDFMQ